MRIVSLCPSNTELVGYLGAERMLVGVDDYSTWPASIKDLPRLGSDLHIDMDRVEALRPDLILASLSVPGMERNIEELTKRGLPFLTLAPHSLSDIRDNLLTVGEAIGCGPRAIEVARAYDRCIEDYRDRSQRVAEPISLYWEWWPKPVFTPGGGNWLTEISELAGARNVFADDPRPSVKTDTDDVRERNPSAIALVWVGIQPDKVKPELVYARDGWSGIDAVKERRVFPLDEPLFCRPSPRLLTGMRKLAAMLHPAVFPPYDEEEDDPLLQSGS
ncbi:cobalamin-binding protein [Paenibacillus sp.]|uniref:cobalamin-binding protein n=1 Tax=Paenibacillus sp. TaxID=58172 RepID=UPI002D7167D7|nr:cobalamin-binding protein [Paenibacillus sp.]HZG87945.1 cobalamin-binding protein [Paenibacillus sp.]